MSLISRIDALPIRAKVLCGTFAYGRTEEPEELGILLRSVSAQMCTAMKFPIGIWRCGIPILHGLLNLNLAIGKKSELLHGRRIS